LYQFFVKNEQVEEDQIVITGSDVNHIGNVLRMKPGEKIRVSDASGQAYFCHITKIAADEVTLAIDMRDELGTEFGHRVVLFQGLPKGDKMELIIQKAVELGVAEIVPVSMKNCVVKLDEKKAESKCKRWQAIAESAAKQSKRSVIPTVYAPVSWLEACNMAGRLDVTLVPYENERGMSGTRFQIGAIEDDASIGVMVGPEGGFAPEEIALTEGRQKMHRISLGRRILRTETAGPATLAMLIYELDI
jgi:16S rRNA (uracil1498-N3)-methyltransferase